MGYFSDPVYEIKATAAMQAGRRRAMQAASAWRESDVAYASMIARSAPWMDAGVALSLARMMADPDTIATAAKASAARKRLISDNPRTLTPGYVPATDMSRLAAARNYMAAEASVPHGFERTQSEIAGPEGLSRQEIQQRVDDMWADIKESGGEVTPDEQTLLANYRKQLEHAGETRQMLTRKPEETHGGGPGLLRQLEQATGTERTMSQVQMAGLAAEGLPAAVRLGAMTLDYPIQEAEGMLRNAYGQVTGAHPDWWEAQSDLGIQITEDTDSGNGFLIDPDSETAKIRRERERSRGTIYGESITLGRLTAAPFAKAGIIDPDGRAYDLISGLTDAAKMIYLDPSTWALAGAGKINRARKLFKVGEEGVEAGLVRGVFYRSIHRPTVDAWLNGKRGQAALKAIAGETSPTKIWRNMSRKVDPELASQLSRARTTGEVRDIIEPVLGKSIRSTKDVWKNPMDVLGVARRTGRRIPGHRIDLDDPQSGMREMESWLQIAHVDDDVSTHFLDRLANAGSKNEKFAVIEDVMDHTKGLLAKGGVKSETARKRMTKLFGDTHEARQKWFVDEAGNNVSVWSDVAVGDEIVSGAGPHLVTEHINRFVPLPDFRQVRSLTRTYPNIFGDALGDIPLPHIATRGARAGAKAGLPRWPTALAHHFQDQIWKPFTLLRGAWPLRVIGEEQLRMTAAGRTAMFRHPVSYVAWSVGRGEYGKIAKQIEKVAAKTPGISPRGALDVLGVPLEEADQFVKAMTRRTAGWLDEPLGRVRTGLPTIFTKNTGELDDYVRGWADEIVQLRNDPVARKIAQSDSMDEVHAWFTSGDGRQYLNELADAHPEIRQGTGTIDYLDSVNKRITMKTAGNDELLDVVRTGKLRGQSVLDPYEMEALPDFRRALDEEFIDIGPDAVKGFEAVRVPTGMRDIVREGWEHATERAFAGLMSKPTNYLSRSPEFRQAYWQRIEELMPYADETTQAAIRKSAADVNLNRATQKRLARAKPGSGMKLNEIDEYAKGYALDDVKSLLYDLSERSQFFDAMRLVFPFGEAWKEVVTRWGKLVAERPQIVRRAQVGLEAARGGGLGEFMGVPEMFDENGELFQPGFFWKDEFGEDVFVYPGSQWLTGSLTKLLSGVKAEVPLVGRVQGLSMFGSIFPGIGPVAAIPTSWLLDKATMGNNDIKRFLYDSILPFGTVIDEGEPSALGQVLNQAPPWMRSAFQAFTGGGFDDQSNRTYANTLMSTATYLYSTGKYDTSTEAGQQKLLDDAEKANRSLFLVRSLVSFGSPSAPKFDFLVNSDEGTIRLAMLRDEYYRLLQDDFETADEKFLERFGDETSLVMQAYTREITGGIGVSREFGDWANSNKDLQTELPNVWAFFGPQSDKFDYNVYRSQLRAGHREALTPKEWLNLSNHHLAMMTMDKLKTAIGPNPTDEDRAFIRSIEAQLMEEYPGFKDVAGVAAKAERDKIYQELDKAVDNKKIRKTEAGKALVTYWSAREKAMGVAADLGYAGIDRAKSLAPDRQALWEIGESLSQENPDFSMLWDRWLKREVEPEAGEEEG